MIRPAQPDDRETMHDVWLRSIRATHDFVSEADIQSYIPLVREYLAKPEPDFWVLCDESGAMMGFMGMNGANIDALFLAPEHFRRGGGSALIRHAQSLHGEITLQVNEQNQGACAFYQSQGFEVTSRSPRDDQGRPYPLLHMRLRNPH